MQQVSRKEHRPRRHWRIWMILGCLAAAAVTAVLLLMNPEKAAPVVTATQQAVRKSLVHRSTEDVARIEVVLDNGKGWAAEQTEPGVLQEDAGFLMDSRLALSYLEAASSMEAEDTVSDTMDVTESGAEEFGLDHPSVTVHVEYTDGSSIGFSVGDHSPDADEGWYYMSVEGMKGLYALDTGSVDLWTRSRDALAVVIQPEIYSSRIDHIVLERGDQVSEWKLEGNIMSDNASDRWRITRPFSYAADGTLMRSFLEALGELRMGTYVGEATEENLKAYGLDTPYARLWVHMASGIVGQTNADGELETMEAEESEAEILFAEPGAVQEFIVYAAFAGQICRVSTITSGRIYDKQAMDTVSRYLVSTAAEHVSLLRIERGGSTEEYRAEQRAAVGEDGSPKLVADGGYVLETYCTWNGEEISQDAFLAKYMPLQNARISGSVEEGYVPQGEPHTVVEITDTSGRKERIRLYAYDSLHDAVQLGDDPVLFYLVKNGLGL